MMRLFRQTFRAPDGEVREISRWYCEFTFGRTRRVPLFNDKAASTDAARKIQKLMDCQGAGEAPSAALISWLEQMPTRLRKRLVGMGLVDSRRVAACQTLTDHLDDYRRAALAKGTTQRQADLVHARVAKVIVGCKFVFWADIKAGAVQAYISGLRAKTEEKDGISNQTANFYLSAIKSFCRWCVRDGRATESPVAYLDGWNVRTDRRHDRRALGVDEVQRLMRAARKGGEVAGMTGDERAMLYHTAIESGLRAGELRSLTRASFRLDGTNPAVVVGAAYSKHRREDVQPIRVSLAEALKVFLATKAPAAPAFNVPRRERVAAMFRVDLEAARAAWLDEARTAKERVERERADYLLYRDAAKRVADFSAASHVHHEPRRGRRTSEDGPDPGPALDDRLDDGSLHPQPAWCRNGGAGCPA